MNNTDKITDKIKHMLAIAHDPSASEAEREQAMNKAHSLMLKHGIEVAHTDQASSSFGTRDILIPGVYAESKAQMMYFIALEYKSFDMVMVELTGTSSVKLTIAGPEEQLDSLLKLLASIDEQADRDRKAWASRSLRGMSRTMQKKHIKSFYLGFGSKVADRIKDILDHEASQADRKALVRVKDQATKLLQSKYDGINYQDTNKRRNSVTGAFAIGNMAGARAQLNNALGH